jgi:hypothetical protein
MPEVSSKYVESHPVIPLRYHPPSLVPPADVWPTLITPGQEPPQIWLSEVIFWDVFWVIQFDLKLNTSIFSVNSSLDNIKYYKKY